MRVVFIDFKMTNWVDLFVETENVIPFKSLSATIRLLTLNIFANFKHVAIFENYTDHSLFGVISP